MKNIAAILITLSLAACASSPNTPPAKISDASNASDLSGKSNADSGASSLTSSEIETRKLSEEMDSLQKQSIYFDLDSFVIKPKFLGIIQHQAAFTKAHRNDVVTIEGNTDERGSNEYNLALSDRRAGAARKNLEVLGVPASQIKTVSNGSEKPRLTCHEEKCWQENRRDDFVHTLN